MEVVRKKLEELTFDPANVRKHSNKNLDAIKASLNRFGQQKPIVVDTKMVVRAGNGTLAAAKDLGWTHINVVVSDLNRADLIAYGIADNRTAELAEWDMEGLQEQLASLDKELQEIAFEDFEFNFDIDESTSKGNTDDDEIPDVDENPYGVQLGDIWQLGNHRLMCGDSTDKEQVDKLMNGEKADMLFTSPPYSDQRDYRGDIDLCTERLSKAIFNFDSKIYFVNLGLQIKNREIVPYWDEYIKTAKENEKKLLFWSVWDKGNASAPGHQQAIFGLCHEWVFVFGDYIKQNHILKNKGAETWGKPTVREKDGSLSNKAIVKNQGYRQLDSVVRIQAVKNYSKEYNEHPAQFPLELVEQYILSSSKENHLVADCFLGSGSTLIACQKTNRRCFGMEIDPHYCSIIIKRWEDFTGEKAVKLMLNH